MAFLILESKNPDFSYLIKKNPHNEKTPILLKKLRQGVLLGTYKDLQTYGILFKEGDNKNSFGRAEDFSYSNPEQYNSPLFVLGAISNFLDHPLKKLEDKDIITSHKLTVGMLRTPRGVKKIINTLSEYFKDKFKVELKEINDRNSQLIIKTDKTTLHEFLNFVNVFFLMVVVRDNHAYRETEGLGRFISSMNVIDAPYFVRYLFKTNWLRRSDDYHKYKKELATEAIKFEFGNTTLMRRDKIQSLMNFSYPIVDLGCGEGFYLKKFITKMENSSYYAIDIDPVELEKAKRKYESIKENLKQVKVDFYKNLSSLKEDGLPKDFSLLMVEVMEHMPLVDAKNLIKEVQELDGVRELFITSPNKDFNNFYLLKEDEMRHHDHDYELTEQEFKDLMTELVDSENFHMEYFYMGDKVEGIYPSIGVKLKRKGNE